MGRDRCLIEDTYLTLIKSIVAKECDLETTEVYGIFSHHDRIVECRQCMHIDDHKVCLIRRVCRDEIEERLDCTEVIADMYLIRRWFQSGKDSL